MDNIYTQKHEKEGMILSPHALVDPWAMVVKSFNANIARIAVPTSRGFNYMAVRTN
jgi:hypothetical protein